MCDIDAMCTHDVGNSAEIREITKKRETIPGDIRRYGASSRARETIQGDIRRYGASSRARETIHGDIRRHDSDN